MSYSSERKCAECGKWITTRNLFCNKCASKPPVYVKKIDYCYDARHDTPCPLPCEACRVECAPEKHEFDGCVAGVNHLKSVDPDGYCNACGYWGDNPDTEERLTGAIRASEGDSTGKPFVLIGRSERGHKDVGCPNVFCGTCAIIRQVIDVNP